MTPWKVKFLVMEECAGSCASWYYIVASQRVCLVPTKRLRILYIRHAIIHGRFSHVENFRPQTKLRDFDKTWSRIGQGVLTWRGFSWRNLEDSLIACQIPNLSQVKDWEDLAKNGTINGTYMSAYVGGIKFFFQISMKSRVVFCKAPSRSSTYYEINLEC